MTSTLESSGTQAGAQAEHDVVQLRIRGGAQRVHSDVGDDELPVAVGFGAPVGVPPRRLTAVPGPVRLARRSDASEVGQVVVLPLRTHAASAGALVTDDLIAAPAVSATGTAPWARAGGAEAAPLRLTARGQAVLLALAAACGLAVVVAAWFGASSATPPARPAPPARVVVHDGDSLWSIASRIAPGRDPRVVVDQLLQVNRLETPNLVPGQVLRTR